MKKISDLAKQYEKYTTENTMWTTIELVDDFLYKMKEYHKEQVEELLEDIENAMNKGLTKESAEHYVSLLVNEDGSKGGKWSCEQIKETLEKKDIPLETKDYNFYDLYYLINMVYSDHNETVHGNIDTIINLALDLAEDVDFPTEKISYAKWYSKEKNFLNY